MFVSEMHQFSAVCENSLYPTKVSKMGHTVL